MLSRNRSVVRLQGRQLEKIKFHVVLLARGFAVCENRKRMKMVSCKSCGGLFPNIKAPTHRYMKSSPGCWAIYGEVLAREYSDPAYFAIHRLTVDTYAVQHPGEPSPQSIKSVGVHLIRLYLLLECGLDMQHANDAMLVINQMKANFSWLTPPPVLGVVTVADVHQATTVEQHTQLVREWATSVWEAWSPHHEIIRQWSSNLK